MSVLWEQEISVAAGNPAFCSAIPLRQLRGFGVSKSLHVLGSLLSLLRSGSRCLNLEEESSRAACQQYLNRLTVVCLCVFLLLNVRATRARGNVLITACCGSEFSKTHITLGQEVYRSAEHAASP